MTDTKTHVTLIPGSGFALRERHSRDTALEVVRHHLEREAAHIQRQLEALNQGKGQVGILRGDRELPLKTFPADGCRWCGVQPTDHGTQYTGWVGSHEWTQPTHQQVTARTVVTVDCSDIEMDNGENLKDMTVGGILELARPTAGMYAGSWRLIEFHGEHSERATLRSTDGEA